MTIFLNLQNEFFIITYIRKYRFRHRVPRTGKKLSTVEIPHPLMLKFKSLNVRKQDKLGGPFVFSETIQYYNTVRINV